MKRLIILLITFLVILVGCGQQPTADFVVSGELENYDVYRDKIISILDKYGYKEDFKEQGTSMFFGINLSEEELVWIQIQAETENIEFSIECDLFFPAKNKLPSYFPEEFLAEIINNLANKTITVEEIKEFISAPDKKYKPLDYDEYMEESVMYGEFIPISYKEKGDVQNGDIYLSMEVLSDKSGSLSISGICKEKEKVFDYVVQIKDIIKNNDFNEWRYYYSSSYEIRLAGNCEISIDMSSNDSGDIYLQPYDFNFSLTYYNLLKNNSERHKLINVPMLVELGNVLSQGKIDASMVNEFFANDDKYIANMYDDFEDDESDYLLDDMLYKISANVDGFDGGFEYALWDYDESFSFYRYIFIFDEDFNEE